MELRSIAIVVGDVASVFGFVVLATPQVAYAGGTIVGTVVYHGKPEEKEFLFSKFPNPKFCAKNPHKELVKGEKRILPTIRVGTDGG